MKDSVEHLRTTFSFSERQACGLVGRRGFHVSVSSEPQRRGKN